MKPLNKLFILILSITYIPFAHAGVGQKIASKFMQYNDELTIAAAAIFACGLIFCGFIWIGNPEKAKKIAVGVVIGALLVFFSPDIASLLAN